MENVDQKETVPDILCLGEPMMEFNRQSDGLYLQGHGGDTSNCAIAASRQGASVGYLTRIGNDRFGQDFIDLWQREGVDCSGIEVCDTAPTGIYFVTHNEEGHHFSYYRQHSASSMMTPDCLPLTLLQSTKLLHVSGISQAISSSAADTVVEAIRVVNDAGGRVSYDTNLRLQLWPLEQARQVIHGTLADCDIALPGLDDARLLTGLSEPDDIADFYLRLGVAVVALTLGVEGTLVTTPDKRQLIPAMPVTAIDATAAGDTFDGAFLAELARGSDPFVAARYANAAAALSTQGYGAVAPMPTRDAVETFMAQHS